MKAIDALATIGVVHDKQMLSVIDMAMAFGAAYGEDLYSGDAISMQYTPADIVAFLKKCSIKNETLKDGSIKLTIARKEGT